MWRIWGFGFLFIPLLSAAQTEPTKCRTIEMSRSEKPLDSLTVIPESITFKTDREIQFQYNPSTGLIYFEAGQILDTITVCYQTIPYKLHHTYQRKSLSDYRVQNAYSSKKTAPNQQILDKKEELFPTGDLQKSGSLSRGISFGNTQNVVVNSALNLQLEGKLSDDLNIRASITDQNVPFQPEGNTAQIQDFDNIYLELYNEVFSLRGGDVVFKNRESNFLRYYKNVQGGLLNTKYKVGSRSVAETSLGVSVAKGKFASIQLEVEEGVSGPYRIIIPNTNDFVIIMANSERVYLDGKRLQRGFNYDYIIDYNKAEIQFTSNVLITKFSRVRIDVEYSDRNYSRSIITGSHYQQVGKARFSFNYYSEKDNPDKPLTFILDEDDKELMRNIGDDLDLAIRESAQETPYNEDEVLYERIDTLDLSSNPVEVFRYSVEPAATLYRVTFTDLGTGKGDYILTNSTVNGRIYQWVSPVNGESQGRYAPISRIPAPNRKDMITLGGEVDISEYEQVFSEVAFSKNDINLFSDLDKNDDHGFAVKGGVISKDRPIGFMNKYEFSAHADYEFDNKYFNPIDRFRYIEFDRDWNYDPVESADQSSDHILTAGVKVEKDVLNRFGYKIVKRKRDVYIDGTQQYADFSQGIGKFQLVTDGFFLRNKTETLNSTWNRINAEASYRSRIFVPGYKLMIDENELRSHGTDSITGTFMHFREHLFFVKSNDSLRTKFGLSYSFREDQSPVAGALIKADESQTARFFINSTVHPNQRLNFLFTYRKNTNHKVAGEPKNEETLIVRSDWYASFFKRHIRSDLTYAIGNGRELKREFIYVQVPTGEGTHTWRDDNGDGIQDLSEFYIAINPDEKNYIKIFVPTNEFVFAYENNFNYRLNFEMPRNWKRSSGVKKLLSRISSTSSWNIIKRITNPELAARILPFYNDIPEEDILSVRESIRTRVFYNRSSPGLGLDFGYFRSSIKQLLSQGFDGRSKEEYTTNARLNLNRIYSLRAMYLWGNSASNSDFLQGRKYSISRQKIVPEIVWQPTSNFRLSILYGYSNKKNTDGELGEEAAIHEITGNLRLSKASDLSLDGFVRYSDIEFIGDSNTPVAYEMLEALQPGQNYSWNMILQKKILTGLQLSLSYEGRKSEGSDAIHIGRMQVSALF
ncbi:MAG: hypothetical protein MI975_18425 [Cytophagales bacterium]|nr:hypothetical protein [Cytophagales bacterium]